MKLDKDPFTINMNMVELNGKKVLIQPSHTESTKGKDVVIGEERPPKMIKPKVRKVANTPTPMTSDDDMDLLDDDEASLIKDGSPPPTSMDVNMVLTLPTESPAYLDPQMTTRTNLQINQRDVVAYFVKAMRHYKDKEMVVVPFNMGNYWVTLSISMKYDQVWYCDSSRSTDPITGDRLSRD
jgi:hypothetical protein